MKRFVTTVVVGLLVMGTAALAQARGKEKEKEKGMKGGIEQAGAHLALADFYLSGAVNATKALQTIAELPVEYRERAHIAEVHGQLDRGITGTATHIAHLRGMALPEIEMAKVDQIERQLKEVKDATRKLRGVKADALPAVVDAIAIEVAGADETFREIARSARFTRLEQMKLGAVPVKGTEEKEKEKEMEMEKEKGTEPMPAPAPTRPGGGY